MRIGIIDLKSILSDKVFLAVEKTGADYQIFEHDVKKEDLKDYVFVDKLTYCKDNCEAEYINRTYKFIRMEDENCAIFYRDY